MTVTVARYRGGDGTRRAVDVAVAAAAAVLTGPLAVLVALAVRCSLGRPVLFRQRRSGLDGAEFTICKFRTMSGERYPGEPDAARLTPVGRTLRTTSLDELPQLWNVLRGEMALIGPRPTLPEQVVHYSERQRGRLAVRPGITGWAQVTARNSVGWPERIELDLWYIAHRSWRLDARIVLRTALQVVRPRGVTAAGGVNPGYPAPQTLPGPAARPDPALVSESGAQPAVPAGERNEAAVWGAATATRRS